jgi:hypothetical protein
LLFESAGQPIPANCNVLGRPVVTSVPGAAARLAAVVAGAAATLVAIVHGIDVNDGEHSADAGAANAKPPALAKPIIPATMRVLFTATPKWVITHCRRASDSAQHSDDEDELRVDMLPSSSHEVVGASARRTLSEMVVPVPILPTIR